MNIPKVHTKSFYLLGTEQLINKYDKKIIIMSFTQLNIKYQKITNGFTGLT